MTRVFHDIHEWLSFRKGPEFLSKKTGFVPTMGALHEGHLSLFRRSINENDYTVGSIFVNPTQFNNSDDLKKYPKNLEKDLLLLSEAGVDFLINPSFESIYPDDYRYKVIESEISHDLCGKHRPGHFDGVLTVVLKLLNLVRPDKAYFGEKDFQQYLLVSEMAKAFFLPTEIVGCPTVREESGLAMSSRNERLSGQQKLLAIKFAEILKKSGDVKSTQQKLVESGIKVDYVEEKWGRRFGAVHVGDVRLIDNVQV